MIELLFFTLAILWIVPAIFLLGISAISAIAIFILMIPLVVFVIPVLSIINIAIVSLFSFIFFTIIFIFPSIFFSILMILGFLPTVALIWIIHLIVKTILYDQKLDSQNMKILVSILILFSIPNVYRPSSSNYNKVYHFNLEKFL